MPVMPGLHMAVALRPPWQAEVLLHLVVMVVRLQYRFFMERPEVPKADSLICRGTSNDLRAPI